MTVDKLPINNQSVIDSLIKISEARSAYILCDNEEPEHNVLFYAKYHERKSAKYRKLGGTNYHLIPVLTPASSLELIKLFAQDYPKLLKASKESLDQITELTGHTQIRWLGSDPLSYLEAEDDEHLALATIYSEGPHQDYFKAFHHYRCAGYAGLERKLLILAGESGDIRALNYLGNAANQVSKFQLAINYYQLTLQGTYKTEEIQYFCQNAALNELIDLYQREIEKGWLLTIFRELAPKGWPKLYAIIGKTSDDTGDHQNAIINYSLFIEKAYCETNPLIALVNKYNQISKDALQNDSFLQENSHAISRRYSELQREISLITKRLEVLKPIPKKHGFFEKQKTIQVERLRTISDIKEAYEKIQCKNSFFSSWDDPNFPQKPTLKLIISLAFSENPKLKTVLEGLKYIDGKGNLRDCAPEGFKDAFDAYLKDIATVQKKGFS